MIDPHAGSFYICGVQKGKNKFMKQSLIFAFLLILSSFSPLVAQTISGVVSDSTTKSPIVGAIITLQGTSNAVVSDIDGRYTISNCPKNKPVTLVCNFIGYTLAAKSITAQAGAILDFAMCEEVVKLGSVSVRGRRVRGNEAAMVSSIRSSDAVVSGISAAQISKSADRDAGEVVRRIPGISIIDDRFVIVRGLAQRYNNVWINSAAVPSSEADGRAFSFDVLPSSQIEDIVIFKSPTAELPADFSGGFIKITTKSIPDSSSLQLNYSSGINTESHFGQIRLNSGKYDDWSVKSFSPIPDMNLGVVYNSRISKKVGMVLAASGGFSNKALRDIASRRYGVYNSAADAPSLEKDYTDNQFTRDVKINAMNNWTFMPNSSMRIDFRNLLNYLDRNRLTERYGKSTVSGDYYERQSEMYVSKRLTYSGQLAGSHSLDQAGMLVWNAGYSYAGKDEPDRRIVKNLGGIPDDGQVSFTTPSYNDMITRYNQKLDDHIASAGVDYKVDLGGDNWKPQLKAGVYGEFRARSYTPLESIYRYDALSADERMEYIYLPYAEMMSGDWVKPGKVYLDDVSRKSNAYRGENTLGAAYVSAMLPAGDFKATVGVRAEWWNMAINYDRSASSSTVLMTEHRYDRLSLLPSLNMSYNFTERHVLRASYGRSVNRPEFRELSPAVYYDFDLFAEVTGNPDLKMATIDNFDIRYEFYPSSGEMLSIGAFYKHFDSPIEWNFVDMGGSYRYSYENARSAYSAGVEIDIRKSLDFIGVPQLTLTANATFVLSKVQFATDGLITQRDRAMQGQSPYIVNAGLYYTSGERLGLSASVLYNLIGERIVGIGKSNSITSDSDYDVPDSYEMPRNLLDLTVAKKLGKLAELKLTVRDILAEKVVFKQFPTATIGGEKVVREQITRSYSPGTSVMLSVQFKF